MSLPVRTHALVCSATLLGALWCGQGGAAAASFQVSPIRLELTPRVSSGLLTVNNQSAEPLRVQVSAFSWSQRRDGEMELSPTKDLVFFPSLLSIAPGEARKIRVGAATQIAGREKTYRVVLEELPALAAGPEAVPAIRMRTRMTIPIFLDAGRPAPAPVIAPISLDAGELTIAIENAGDARFVARQVRVRGRAAGGDLAFDKTLSGWYVLAGTGREWRLPIGADCERLRGIEVELLADDRTLSASFERPERGCAR